MGRKKISEKNPELIELLFSVYFATGDQKEAARRAHMTTRTARKYLHEKGIYPKRGITKGKYYPRKFKGKFPTWVRENPQINLEGLSMEDLVSLSGCSMKDIYNYFRRLRIAIEREIKTLPDLRDSPGAIPDLNKTLIPFALWKQYSISRKGYTRTVRITVLGKNGVHYIFDIHLDALWSIISHQKVRNL